MLRRNIDTSIGLVNGALGTVVSIKAHHIAVLFDNIPEPYRVENVKSKFMVLKKIFVYRKQFPLILAFAVTIHKCQDLSLDCAMMELSDQVFRPGMAYVALSRVKQLENLHLIAFKPQSVMVSNKCLQELNRLRQTYRPDLPQYSAPTTQGGTKKRKIKWKVHVHLNCLILLNQSGLELMPVEKRNVLSCLVLLNLSRSKKLIPVVGRERQYHKLVINCYHQKKPAVIVTRHVIQK